MQKRKNKLNIGCGDIYHASWENIDTDTSSRFIKAVDIRRGLPYVDESFDVVYSAHLLEHLRETEGERLLKECYRVLRSHGTVRILVPDLERQVHGYLKELGRARRSPQWHNRYAWSKIELLDLIGANAPGGTIDDFLQKTDKVTRAFVLKHLGGVSKSSKGESIFAVTKRKVTDRDWRWVFAAVHRWAVYLLVLIVGGKEYYRSLRTGIFRRSGNIHQTMYDSYSLSFLLRKTGFVRVKAMDCRTSNILGFAKYHLDVVNNRVRRPDSLVVEAQKP